MCNEAISPLARMMWTVGGHLWLCPSPTSTPRHLPCPPSGLSFSIVFSLAAHFRDFHLMTGPCLYCDSLAPAAFGLTSSLGPWLENNICSSGLAFSAHRLSRPPPRAALHLIPGLWDPGVDASSVPATPSLNSQQGKGFFLLWFFCCCCCFLFRSHPHPLPAILKENLVL